MRYILYKPKSIDVDFSAIMFDATLTENVLLFFKEKTYFEVADIGNVTFVERFVCKSDNENRDNAESSEKLNWLTYKYISYGEPKCFILFNNENFHDQIARDFHIQSIKSAAFAFKRDKKLLCSGQSLSLGLNAAGEDSELLNRFFE